MHREDITSAPGDVQYIGDTSGDIMSTSGDIIIHVGEQVDKSLSFISKTPMY